MWQGKAGGEGGQHAPNRRECRRSSFCSIESMHPRDALVPTALPADEQCSVHSKWVAKRSDTWKHRGSSPPLAMGVHPEGQLPH